MVSEPAPFLALHSAIVTPFCHFSEICPEVCHILQFSALYVITVVTLGVKLGALPLATPILQSALFSEAASNLGALSGSQKHSGNVLNATQCIRCYL